MEGGGVNLVPPLAWLSSPHRGTGLALCVRPPFRASASAALTQALPNFCQLRGVQRLGPERIASAALRICRQIGPPQVARTLCPGPAPEQAAPSGAPRIAAIRALLYTQRPGHATSAISAAPSERRRAGHAANAAPAARPGLIRAAQPAASEGSEGSREQGERPRVHERVAYASGASECKEATAAHASGGSAKQRMKNTEHRT
jgi:hypothetical protein